MNKKLFNYLFKREFTLAEIEHFVNPDDKSHPKFDQVSSMIITLYPRENQLENKKTIQISIGEAVNKVLKFFFYSSLFIIFQKEND